MRASYEDCMKKNLLVKVPASKNKATRSLEKARLFLDNSRKNLDMNIFDGAVILAYLSIFHAARSVLIRDGFREKSHVCISRYLEKFYSPNKLKKEHITLLDRYRNLRHADQYDVSFYATKSDAEDMISFSSEFIESISKLLSE